MFSRCPHCDHQQSVSTRQLREKRALLICKACGKSFDALPTLSESVDEVLDAPSSLKPILESKAQKLPNWFWGMACGSMLMLFLGQIGYFYGLRLYSEPLVHQALTSVCRAFECRLPVAANSEDWSVSHSDLQSFLNRRYQLTAALTNQGNIAHRFPELKLTLTDFNGHILAERIFAPGQYITLDELAANQTVAVRLPFVMEAGDVGGFSLTLH